MKKLLALDISSSTIGWAIFKYDEASASLYKYGHIKPLSKAKSKNGLPERVESARKELVILMDKHKIDEVVVEDYVKGFSRGRSQANTIILLSVFNEICCLTAYLKTGCNPERYPVATIRKTVGNLFGTKVVSKDDIFPEIVKNCKKFKTVNNRAGNIKKECGDEADAISVGITAIVKKEIKDLTWIL